MDDSSMPQAIDPAVLAEIGDTIARHTATPAPPQPQPQPPQAAPGKQVTAETFIAMLEHGIMGQEGFLQQLGIPVAQMVHFHVMRAAVLVATHESQIARDGLTDKVLQTFAAMVQQHFVRIHTQNGIFVPPAGTQVPQPQHSPNFPA